MSKIGLKRQKSDTRKNNQTLVSNKGHYCLQSKLVSKIGYWCQKLDTSGQHQNQRHVAKIYNRTLVSKTENRTPVATTKNRTLVAKITNRTLVAKIINWTLVFRMTRLTQVAKIKTRTLVSKIGRATKS